jgi:uncharacterized membrane protein
MNKTEYMNTLQQELQGLPASVVAETLASYQQKFQNDMANGLSESEIIQKLASPRLVAAQQRANTRFQSLKRHFGPGNILGFFVALIGVAIFNFFMLIPAFLYGVFLFCAYIGSLVLYVAGTVMIAASLSGVPEMEFKFPDHHTHGIEHSGRHVRGSHMGNVTVDISETGILVNKDRADKLINQSENSRDLVFHSDNRPGMVRIKNHMESRHFFYGFGLLIGATGLLLICLWLTRLTVIGFGKYLLWTVSLLRAPARAESTANA